MAVNRAIAGLKHRGLIESQKNASDRRIVDLSLDRGRAPVFRCAGADGERTLPQASRRPGKVRGGRARPNPAQVDRARRRDGRLTAGFRRWARSPNSARSAFRSILPRSFLGRLAHRMTSRGRLNSGNAAVQCARTEDSSSAAPGRGGDEGHHRLAIDRIGRTDHGRLGHVGMGGEHVVDLERRDVDPAADDDVLCPSGDVQKAVGVDEARGRRSSSACRGSPRNGRRRAGSRGPVCAAADLDLAGLALRECLAVRSQDAQVLIEAGPPRRCRSAGRHSGCRRPRRPRSCRRSGPVRCRRSPRIAGAARPSGARSNNS